MDYLNLSETLRSLGARLRAMFKERKKRRAFGGLSEKATAIITDAVENDKHIFVRNDSVFVGSKFYTEGDATPIIEELEGYGLIEIVVGIEHAPTRFARKSKAKLLAAGDAFVVPMLFEADRNLLSKSDVKQGDRIELSWSGKQFNVRITDANGVVKMLGGFKDSCYFAKQFAEYEVVDWYFDCKRCDLDRIKRMDFKRDLDGKKLVGIFTARAERIAARKN